MSRGEPPRIGPWVEPGLCPRVENLEESWLGQVVLIARWRTAGDFMTAIQSPGFGRAAAGLAGYQAHPALYEAVRT